MMIHPQTRVCSGGNGCMPYQERQLSSSRNTPTTDGDCGELQRESADDTALRVDEEREIKDGPDEEETAEVDIGANVVFGSIAPFADEPRGNEEERKCLLSLVLEEHPSAERCDRPHENGRGPVLLDIEDLADECDRCAGGDCANSMERAGCCGILGACDGSAKMEDADHGHHEQVAHARAELVPVRGDEEDDATGEEDSAKDQGHSALPGESRFSSFDFRL